MMVAATVIFAFVFNIEARMMEEPGFVGGGSSKVIPASRSEGFKKPAETVRDRWWEDSSTSNTPANEPVSEPVRDRWWESPPAAQSDPPYPSASDPIEFEKEAIAYLRDYALDLSAEGTPGVELYTEVAREAVEIYNTRDDMTIQQKYDAVVRDLTIVFTGADNAYGHLVTFENMNEMLGRDTNELVQESMAAVLAVEPEFTPATGGGTLDTTNGSDFAEEYNDGGPNQIYHAQFYVWMGYATEDSWAVSRGNFVHELQYNVGGSAEDYNLGIAGTAAGMTIRALRNAGSEEGLQMLPDIIGASFSNEPEAYIADAGLREQIQQVTHGMSGNFVSDAINAIAMGKDKALIWIVGLRGIFD